MTVDGAPPRFTTRLARALRRFRTDGRLPETTSRLFSDYWRLAIGEVTARSAAALLPPVGGWLRGMEAIRPVGSSRRWYVTGEATMSSFELAHEQAGALVEPLKATGLHPFLLEASDRSLTFGLRAGDRTGALRALMASRGRHWYLTSARGRRTRTTLLAKVRPGRVLDAETWKLFRVHATGPDSVAGPDEAATLTFWTDEDDGWAERIGFRGLHRYRPDEARPTLEYLDGRTYPGVTAFPVAKALGRFEEPIDFVYTWVDGDDPAWQAAFARWKEREPDGDEQSLHPSRFRSLDELRFSLRSVWLYAGWFRRLYIVTSGQVPHWLAGHERVSVVPHTEIIAEEHLPTFNSHAIEASLHRIEGLAEHFVYMNDDVFLGRPLARSDFFTPCGALRFVESQALIPPRMSEDAISDDQAAVNNRRLIEEEFGRAVRYKLDHAPHPLLRSVMSDVESRFRDAVATTVSHRFRHRDDVSVASGLAQFVAAATGRATPSQLRNGYMNVENPRLGMFLRTLHMGRRFSSFCLNQTEVPTSAATPDPGAAEVTRFLSSYFGVPAPWEAG